MRIALTSLYLPGSSKIGVGYQVHQFANRMVERGHEVSVLSPDLPGIGHRYEHVTVDPGGSARTFRFAWRLRHQALDRFDVLHAHGDDHFLGRVRRPPHVRTVHGSCFEEARRVRGAKEKVRMALLGAGEVISTSAVADRSFAVSHATRRLYPWLDGVIPNGIDVPDVLQREPSAEPTILFVGTYRNRKRGQLLMEQFANVVRPAIPETRLLMVCEDAPREAGVEVLGRVSDDELLRLYQSAWAFCLPSSYEGFGLPYAEAMANGCPVVATPNAGALEVLDGGRFGVITSPDLLGTSLVELLLHGARRTELGSAGRERAKLFAWATVLARYERVYEELLEQPPRRLR